MGDRLARRTSGRASPLHRLDADFCHRRRPLQPCCARGTRHHSTQDEPGEDQIQNTCSFFRSAWPSRAACYRLAPSEFWANRLGLGFQLPAPGLIVALAIIGLPFPAIIIALVIAPRRRGWRSLPGSVALYAAGCVVAAALLIYFHHRNWMEAGERYGWESWWTIWLPGLYAAGCLVLVWEVVRWPLSRLRRLVAVNEVAQRAGVVKTTSMMVVSLGSHRKDSHSARAAGPTVFLRASARCPLIGTSADCKRHGKPDDEPRDRSHHHAKQVQNACRPRSIALTLNRVSDTSRTTRGPETVLRTEFRRAGNRQRLEADAASMPVCA